MANCLTKSKSKQLTKPAAKKQVAKPAIKKLKPASITAQKAWQGFPSKLKKELRKSLPDTDKDRVPDGFDCRPRNKRRQESFNSADAAYLASKPNIVLSKKLGNGFYGDFYTIGGNDNLGVKVPRCWLEEPCLNDPDIKMSCDNCKKKQDIIAEAKKCRTIKVNEKPLLAATRVVSVQRNGKKCIGLVRQLVKDLSFSKANELTDSQLETIRRRLIEISRLGIAFSDGLQAGFTKSGRFLQYDLDAVDVLPVGAAFEQNDLLWRFLLSYAGKLQHCREKPNSTYSERNRCENKVYEKYGRVRESDYDD